METIFLNDITFAKRSYIFETKCSRTDQVKFVEESL